MLSHRCVLSASWASVWGTTRRILAFGTRPPAPPMSFVCPTAHQATRVHFARILPARYVPPSGFGYPLDGLLPSGPCRLCFTPTALLGFALRSMTSPEVPERYRTDEPTYRSNPRCGRRRSTDPARWSAVPGFLPPGEPLPPRLAFGKPTRGSSPGLFPSRALGRPPCPGFRRNSSHALGDYWMNQTACATESQSTAAWSGPSMTQAPTRGPNSPLKVPAPLSS